MHVKMKTNLKKATVAGLMSVDGLTSEDWIKKGEVWCNWKNVWA